MSAVPTDDLVLWQRLRTGDELAFAGLFERYYASLVGYGKSLMPNPERVKDCVQDVFADVWVYRQSLSQPASVKAYLLSCVRKRIARLHERDAIFRRTTPLDETTFSLDFSIEDRLIADEETAFQVAQLNRQINALPARQKEALYLRYYQALTIEQITVILDINYQSVTNLIHRAIQHLRKEWKGDLTLLFALLLKIPLLTDLTS